MNLISKIFLIAYFYPTLSFAIAITQQSDLEFGTLLGGDSAKTIAPGTAETAENASFRIREKKNTAYTIILPSSMTLNGSNGGSLTVTTFVSFPPEGPNGMTDNRGKQLLYVGATIQAISFSQPAGSYTGNFTVDVIL